MKTKVRIYKVQAGMFSAREIQARNKKEAISLFKFQMRGYITKNDRITVH